MSGIITFGEIMMHLQPPSYKRLIQADSFTACFGGSEANTAVALAQWGEKAAFVTKLPENELGDACIRSLKALDVDTSHITRGAGRMGLYFTERGASQRPPHVLYDRGNSVFSLSKPDDYDFDNIFSGADWFHFSGITPALGKNIADISAAAINTARSKKLKISCDFNYRSLLWSPEQARETMSQLIKNIDVLIINESQAEEILDIKSGSIRDKAEELLDRYQAGLVAVTGRVTVSGEINEFSAMVYDGKDCYPSRSYSIFMVDKIGGGDAFGAGIIYGILNKKGLQETVDFAAAAACCKHTVEGDMLMAGIPDIEWIMRSDGNGRMQR